MLTSQQKKTLAKSIGGYCFPAIYYNFASNVERNAGNMRSLEGIILNMLTSKKQHQVKYGLANVIYWGNAKSGYQKNRTCKFLNKVSSESKNAQFTSNKKNWYASVFRYILYFKNTYVSGPKPVLCS